MTKDTELKIIELLTKLERSICLDQCISYAKCKCFRCEAAHILTAITENV